MGPLLGPEVSAQLVASARAADRRSTGATDLVAALSELSDQVVRPGFVSTGFSEVRCDEFVSLFVAYLHWLAGAAELPQRRGWEHAWAVESATDGVGLTTFDQPAEYLVAGVDRLPVEHLHLMRSDETARAVDERIRQLRGGRSRAQLHSDRRRDHDPLASCRPTGPAYH